MYTTNTVKIEVEVDVVGKIIENNMLTSGKFGNMGNNLEVECLLVHLSEQNTSLCITTCIPKEEITSICDFLIEEIGEPRTFKEVIDIELELEVEAEVFSEGMEITGIGLQQALLFNEEYYIEVTDFLNGSVIDEIEQIIEEQVTESGDFFSHMVDFAHDCYKYGEM